MFVGTMYFKGEVQKRYRATKKSVVEAEMAEDQRLKHMGQFASILANHFPEVRSQLLEDQLATLRNDFSAENMVNTLDVCRTMNMSHIRKLRNSTSVKFMPTTYAIRKYRHLLDTIADDLMGHTSVQASTIL
jgi:hypothetical protein